METAGVVERIRLLLARFPEDEETVRRLVATDSSFGFEVQVKRLGQRRAWLEEELLTRIEGHQPR